MKLSDLARERMEIGRVMGKCPHDGRDFIVELEQELADAFNYSLIADRLYSTRAWVTRALLRLTWAAWHWETRKVDTKTRYWIRTYDPETQAQGSAEISKERYEQLKGGQDE